MFTKFDLHQGLLDYPYEDFDNHISKVGNNRILFSGKFGIGKSFFLDHFFKEDVQQSKRGAVTYESFHIYPVNYSISSNDDVFRYIKYDVITTLLLKNIQLEETDLSYLDTLPEYLKGNLIKVMATLIYMIPKVGKDVYDSYEKLEALRQDFLKHDQFYKQSEGDRLVEFLEKIENKEGSIFENDIITKLISNILNRIKTERKRETVLIIDDMDRIDPEHVFRLLNVFAAHLDHPNNLSNKLGFDKVIIVCDIQNLRNIFKAKYGGETDFNGYIDKFYSYDVYHFDNRKILHEISYQAFKSIRITGDNAQSLAYYKGHFFNHHSLGLDLCTMLIYNNYLNLRNLISRISNQITIDVYQKLEFGFNMILSQGNVPLFVHFKILKELVGGYNILKDCLLKIPEKGYVIENLNKNANILMYFVFYEQTFNVSGTATLFLNGKALAMKINGSIIDNLDQLVVYERANNTSVSNPDQYKFTLSEFKTLLSEFIDLLIRLEN